MASFETSVFISVLLALILIFVDYLLLPTLLVSVLPIVVFAGFIASAMAGSEKNSYRVGGTTGGVLAVLFFLVKFFTPPALTFNLYSLGFDVFLMFEGLVYLILGFVVSLAVFMLLGAFGGLIAQELFRPEEPKSGKKDNSKPLKN